MTKNHLTKGKFVSLQFPKEIENRSVQFSSALAHEIRTPLTSIILSINELVPFVAHHDEAKIYLDIITRSAVRINKIAGLLLKLKELEAIQWEEYSLHKLLEEVIELTGDRIRLQHITVNKYYGAQDYRILMNVQGMKMALTNIVVNALDAMTIDVGQLNIVTRSIAGIFIIQIEDNGCGINEEDLKNIFNPHFTKKKGGLGIGLASTCNILRSHNVGVNVKSQEGKGTCFKLVFNKGFRQGAENAHTKNNNSNNKKIK